MTLDLRFKGLLALSGKAQTFTVAGRGVQRKLCLFDQQNIIKEVFTRGTHTKEPRQCHQEKIRHLGNRGGIRISNKTLH